MQVVPKKAFAIRTPWLDMPTGYSIAWTRNVPIRLCMSLARISDDLDLAKSEQSVREISILNLINSIRPPL